MTQQIERSGDIENNGQSTYEKICRNFALNFTADFFGKILRAKSLQS